MFSKFFINRPIFATVLALLIVVAGLVALNILPVAQFPEITPPTVQVSAVYPGANAETVAQTVGLPIEQQVNGVDGMLYIFKFFLFGSIFSDNYICRRYRYRYGYCTSPEQGKCCSIILAGTGSGTGGDCAETVFEHCHVPDNDFERLCIQQSLSD